MKERWAPVKSYGGIYDGLYEVSNTGKVRTKARANPRPNHKYRIRNKVGKQKQHIVAIKDPYGCARVNMIDKEGKRTLKLLKVLVADAWMYPRTGAKVIQIDPKKKGDWSINNLKEKGKPNPIKISHQKLEIYQVKEIIKIIKEQGYKRGIEKELARKYKVRRSTINAIVCGQNWSILTGIKK